MLRGRKTDHGQFVHVLLLQCVHQRNTFPTRTAPAGPKLDDIHVTRLEPLHFLPLQPLIDLQRRGGVANMQRPHRNNIVGIFVGIDVWLKGSLRLIGRHRNVGHRATVGGWDRLLPGLGRTCLNAHLNGDANAD